LKDAEHKEQTMLIRWFRLQYPKEIMFAVPNGGLRHIRTAARLKDEGVTAGVADLFLMSPRGGKSGLFIEMKALKGRLTDSQQYFLTQAELKGYATSVCFGFDEAKKTIEDYLR